MPGSEADSAGHWTSEFKSYILYTTNLVLLLRVEANIYSQLLSLWELKFPLAIKTF